MAASQQHAGSSTKTRRGQSVNGEDNGGEKGRSATARKGDVLRTYEQEEQGFITHKREEQRLTCMPATKGGTAGGRRPAMRLRWSISGRRAKNFQSAAVRESAVS
ncbi:hypothetical protein SESBI_21247 [Sesbania bispinosa]|nr:hypothetical protein SESBI_21247 [Sesbania bispinosa]